MSGHQRFRRGLVVGKFCPLHRGHMVLIDAALAACDEVLILSWTNPEFDGCGPDVRAGWLHALYPGVRALVVAHGMPANDAPDAVQRHFTGWLCREKLGTTVDAVFTSEDYGDGLALALTAYFGAPVTHVSVDQARAAVPISGTAIRADPHAQRHYLDPRVYASFVRRVAILGGESSGKTTLARALALELATVWAPEYGRQLWERQGGVLGFGDMLHIGRQQCAREQALAQQAYRWLVCDTSPLVTAFYSEALFGAVDPALQQLSQRPYAVTFVCAPAFPFVQDGTRQDAAFRQRQHAWYLAELARRGVAYTLLEGAVGARVAQAARTLADSARIGASLPAEEIPHA
jgi:HTH-type transcriptional repressor of NAD biosynthesis genes